MPLATTRSIRTRLALLSAGLLGLVVVAGLAAGPATAAVVCSPGGDQCVVVPDTVDTPLGPATITVSATNVVTVALATTAANTLVVGLPIVLQEIPRAGCPGGCAKSCPGGCSRTTTTLDTGEGVVTIDTIVFPPGPPTRPALPSLVFVTLAHPPSPCRVTTTGTTVTFTPIAAPAPAG
jgi:hypothetical protein